MDHLQEAWEVRLDGEGRVLASDATASPLNRAHAQETKNPGGGRYLVIPQDDGSLDLLALEVYPMPPPAQGLQPPHADAGDARSGDPAQWGHRALGDLSQDPQAPLPLPGDSSLVLVDPTQPDRPQPAALASQSPEALNSALGQSQNEWTYWLTQNRDALNLWRQRHPEKTGAPASTTANAATPASAVSSLPRSGSSGRAQVSQPVRS